MEIPSKRFLGTLALFLVHFISVLDGQGIILVTPVTPAIVNPNPNCQCTPATNCADGATGVDPRVLNNPAFITCTPPNRFCCNLITTVPTAAPTTACGVQPFLPFPAFVPAAGQATYTEFPWMALVLGTDNTYVGGGVLLDGNTVLTVAHKVTPSTVTLKVRLGEFIIGAGNEPYNPIEIAVSAIRIHPAYNVANLENDIAILKLASSVDFVNNPHIRTICLPTLGQSFVGQRCWVSGFGASSFVNGVYSQTLRKVDLPILDGPTCQARLQTTRLGTGYILNQQAFVCAGGEPGRDACTGDGGSPLVCQTATGWQVAGLVSWGVGCGANTIPGVYTTVPNHINWITANRV